jgi:DnaJ-class molecular chaperone
VADRDWQGDISLEQERERKARAILGVSEKADQREIRRAFRRASIEHHPDLNRNDENASWRFQLACCAYKFLTEGEACTALDELDSASIAIADGKYRLDNTWGYWCWWRENFFEI